MRILIGIDDTDNLETEGTGHRVRTLCQRLMEAGLAQGRGITRHQLLVSPEIPYTSHNSSACLDAETLPERLAELWTACRSFLLAESAPGSDAGLCLAAFDQAGPRVRAFGVRAKTEVLRQAEAQSLADAAGIRLEGLTGTGGGIIGALAGVGLHAAGEDGRFLWMPGLREMTGERVRTGDLTGRTGIGAVTTLNGRVLEPQEWIDLGAWPRPVLRAGQAVLLVEEDENGWHCLSKEIVKQISE